MPDAIATPSRSWSTSASARPESAHASSAATSASWPDRSSLRALTRSSTSVGSTATSAAIWVLSWSAQSCLIGRTPECPARRAAQVVGTSPPTGDVLPSPVTTTRVALIVSSPQGLLGLCWGTGRRHRCSQAPAARRTTVGSAVLGALDERDGVADGLEVLDLVVGDLDVELLLGGHDDLDHGERVDVEVVDERLVELDVVGGNAGHLVDDVGEVGADLLSGCHWGELLRWLTLLRWWVVLRAPAASTTGICGSGDGDDLRGVGQAGAEGDQQGDVAALGLALLDHPAEGERDGGRRGVALVGDVAGDLHRRRQLHRAGHSVDDPHVRLVRHEHVEVVDRDAGPVQRLGGDLGHLVGRPPEHRAALHHQVRHRRLVLGHHVAPVLGLTDQVELLAVGAPDDRADAHLVGGSDHRAARAVGEDEGGAAVVQARDVGEPLDADHQHVLGAAAADHVRAEREAVAEPGAGGRDVEGGRLVGAELVGDRGGDGWGLQHVRHRRDDHAVDLRRLDAGPLHGLAGRGHRHHLDALVGPGEAPLLDAGALLDPLVAGVDGLDDLGVGDHPRRAVGADPQELGLPGAGRRLECGGHALTPSGWRRISGWPGETMSPSSTSHSTIVPPYGAVTANSSWRLCTAPIRASGAMVAPSGRSAVWWNVPLVGATSIRQVGFVSSTEAPPCFWMN